MRKIMKNALCVMLCLVTVFSLFTIASTNISAATSFPNNLYIQQATNYTCTLASATMMLRARTYLSGNDNWSTITESAVQSVAWGSGLKWSFTYAATNISITTAHASVSGISISSLKGLINSHPEGIVLYCGNYPHAVFVTDYEGDTFYCADPAAGYSGNRRKLSSSSLASKYSSQSSILSNVTAYWYVSSYNITGGSHTHSYDTFSHFSSSHPHTAYYKCSCNETKEDSSKKQFVETCAQCKNSQSGISYESIENGNYYLTIPSDGRYLNNSYGNDEEGNNLHIHTFGDYDSQVYTIRNMGDGYEMMPLSSTTRVVGVAETYVVSGNSVKLYTKNSGKNQLWKFQKVNGGYVIRNAQNPNLCLMPFDYGMIVSDYNGGERQIWKLEKNCTVTYDANGGMGVPASSRTKQGDSLQLTTQIPTRQCHKFLGWAPYWDSINASYQGGQTIQMQKDMTLYAIWKANHEYTNDSDSDCNICGANREDATSQYEPIAPGKYYLSIPSDGRYLNNSYGNDEEGNNLHIHTFSDYDCQVYTIRDMGDGYEMMPLSSTTRVVGVAEKTVMSGNGVKLYTRTSSQNQWWKFQPVEGGYVIRNAQNPNLCLMPFDYGLIVSEYTGGERQIWKLEKACTISYNANGGTGAPAASRVRGGYSTTISSTEPSRTGYRFLGWSLQSDGTTASYQANQTITVQNDTTLYAVWLKETSPEPVTNAFSLSSVSNAKQGDMIEVNFNVDQPNLNLCNLELTVHYDENYLTPIEQPDGFATMGSIWNGAMNVSNIENMKITMINTTPCMDTGVLFKMYFKVIAPIPVDGSTVISANVDVAGDSNGNPLTVAVRPVEIWGANQVVYGDLDDDDKPTSADALTVLKSVVGKEVLTNQQKIKADVNGDTTVNSMDALLILQKVVGKIQKFPVEQ